MAPKRKLETALTIDISDSENDSNADDEALIAALKRVQARVAVPAAAKAKATGSSSAPPAKKAKKSKAEDDGDYDAAAEKENAATAVPKPSAPKPSGSATTTKSKKLPDVVYARWQDVPLPGEEEGNVSVFDDCNDIRRKITALRKEPGFKVTHWLRDIGNINSNSLTRFTKASGPTGGAENQTYYAAYVYFEKVRIMERKKKTPKRERNEIERGPSGFPMRDLGRGVTWVLVARDR